MTEALGIAEKEIRSLEVVRLALTGRLKDDALWSLRPYQRAYIAAAMLCLLSNRYNMVTGADGMLRFQNNAPHASVVDVLRTPYTKIAAAKQVCAVMYELGLITKLGNSPYLTLPRRLFKLVDEIVTIDLIRERISEIERSGNDRRLEAASVMIQKIVVDATLGFSGDAQGKAMAHLLRTNLPKDVLDSLIYHLRR